MIGSSKAATMNCERSILCTHLAVLRANQIARRSATVKMEMRAKDEAVDGSLHVQVIHSALCWSFLNLVLMPPL